MARLINLSQGLIVGLILGMALSAYALTTAQVSEHFGRLVRRGFSQDLASAEREKELLMTFAIYARDWVPNGNFGTQAERLEAVQTIFREFFTAQTGMNGTLGLETDRTSGRHIYKRHWLVGEIGLTAQEVNTLEP